MNNLSNMIMELYEAESLALRVQKLDQMRGESAIHRAMLDVFLWDAASLALKNAKDALYSSMPAAEADKIYAAVDVLLRQRGVNVRGARRCIAAKLLEDNDYKL